MNRRVFSVFKILLSALIAIAGFVSCSRFRHFQPLEYGTPDKHWMDSIDALTADSIQQLNDSIKP